MNLEKASLLIIMDEKSSALAPFTSHRRGSIDCFNIKISCLGFSFNNLSYQPVPRKKKKSRWLNGGRSSRDGIENGLHICKLFAAGSGWLLPPPNMTTLVKILKTERIKRNVIMLNVKYFFICKFYPTLCSISYFLWAVKDWNSICHWVWTTWS